MNLPRSVLAMLIVSLASAASANATDWVVNPARARDAGLQAYWQTQLPMLAGEAVTGVSVADRQVYVTTNLGVLHAVAVDTGLIRWTVSLAGHGSEIFTPQNIGADPQDGFVLVTTVADLYMLDQLDGATLVKLGLRLPPSGPAVTNGQRIYVGGNNGWLHGIPLNDGNIEQRAAGTLVERLIKWTSFHHGMAQVVPGRTPKNVWSSDWAVRNRDIVPSPPAVVGDLLYYSSGQQIFCIAAADKTGLWSRAVRGDIAGPIIASERGVFIATRDNNLICLDASDGRLSWRNRVGGPCTGSPVLVDGVVYQSTEAGLYAIDAASGSTRWRVPDGRELLAVNGEHAFVRVGGAVTMIDRASGRVGPQVLLPFDASVATNITGPAIVATTDDGVVLCLMPKEVPYLRSAEVRRELRRPPAADAALDAELREIVAPPSGELTERHPLDASNADATAGAADPNDIDADEGDDEEP